MVGTVDVLVGATFAADALHARVPFVFQTALPSVSATLQWMPYGQWRALLPRPHAQTTNGRCMTLLFLRTCDALALLTSHVALNPSRHLVVVLCPSPPDASASTTDDEYLRAHMPANAALVSDLRAVYGASDDFYNATLDLAMHNPYSPWMNNLLALQAARQICRVFRRPKKVLILDCDHTLWSGAIAEDGLAQIEITAAHAAFQIFLLEQYASGTLLCLCSKNIPADVQAVFERHPDMHLDLDTHIVSSRINHELKGDNIAAMLHELSLSMDSAVFFDDNALECAAVRASCPSLAVVHVPLLPKLTPNFAATVWALDANFGAVVTTAEDKARTAMYKRQLQAKDFGQDNDTTNVLAALGMHVEMQTMTSATPRATLERIAQLCQRTNQFNLQTTATRAYTSVEQLYALASTATILYVSVTDKYGHYGLVGVAVSRCTDRTVHIPLLLLSCRVLNRRVEHAMLQRIAVDNPCKRLRLLLEPTIRNAPIRMFLTQLTNGTGIEDLETRHVLYEIECDDVCGIYDEAPIVQQTLAAPPASAVECAGEPGCPTVALHCLDDVTAFFAPLEKADTSSSVLETQAANVAKFRRLQREAVKRHVEHDTPIWTTNNVTERQRCRQPACVQEIPLTTQCLFRRCRTCCYQTQKLLERATTGVHPQARAAASAHLRAAGVEVGTAPYCTMHVNPRRAAKRSATAE
ncbi:hypothetical protein SPRG_20653 [Saprolegnia parasitica CBS 223.65]|uniref:FCP1 homology domain-containing protein n=1 Tax=Saprolegnia parasitica (strain CBS 223.65) TaxID=695850 RepID=A0A067CFD3_SAPPC|nr:hypothetical protein SPRG_20653 [Saprolegnia parasitica CBS 223.65]KDO25532.1 hypothetical protein SPRG_20653 [Saprolegnia parasitica CBS 223.65]|eukprot:XP_012203762.1 hypothetical protein SPRG_20653 [Saprolegnia parasitica CBS 223.65]